MAYVEKIVTERSFDAMGKLVEPGHVGIFDDDRLSGKEEHLADVGDYQPAIVQVAPIGPTGPNPTMPQQIPPDAVQDATGNYAQPGKRLVAEVTQPAEVRLEQRGLADPDAEAKASEQLSEVMDTTAAGQLRATAPAGGRGQTTGNADDGLVAGTVADVTANLGARTDAELEAMRAAENDREQPRKGVISAIDAELDSRKTSA